MLSRFDRLFAGYFATTPGASAAYSGSWPLLILLANSNQAASAMSVRNFERLVVASSAPPSHSVILAKFIVAAVATCWRWVLARPT